MKKLILLTAIIFIGCSSEDEDNCGCQKLTYELTQGVFTPPNGLPITTVERELISTEDVVCQDEQTEVTQSENIVFDIECN